MKKFSIYAMTAAAALTMTGALPFSALAAQNTYQAGKGNVIVIGGNGMLSGSGSFGDGSCSLGGLISGGLGNGRLISGSFGSDCLTPGGFGSGCLTPDYSGSDCSGSDCLTPGGFGSGSGTTAPDITIPAPETPGSQTPGLPSDGVGTGGSTDNTGEDSAIAEVVSLVNAERAKAGLAPLTLNSEISKAAETRAGEIQTSFSHTRPGGKSFSTVLTEAGISYRASGENIAYGQSTASKVMSDWMNSSGHRANILNSSFTQIGVGHVKNASGTDYWVQLFTN